MTSVNIWGNSGDERGDVDLSDVNSEMDTKVNKDGDQMNGDLYLNINNDHIRVLGCNDLNDETGFSVLLGSTENQIQYEKQESSPQPIKILSTDGTLFQMNDEDYLRVGEGDNKTVIAYKPLHLMQGLDAQNNTLYNLANPIVSHDAATKHYVDSSIPKPNSFGQKPYATGTDAYEWQSYETISPNITESEFDELPSGLYGCYSNYIPTTRRGILPNSTKGYLIAITYQQPIHRNKLYIYITNDNREYRSRFVYGQWITWDIMMKNYCGYLPLLEQNDSKTGFTVSASSSYDADFQPYNVRRNTTDEWATASVTSNFWIKVSCPERTRLWRIALRGRNSGTERIYNWKFQGSNDDLNFTTIYRAPNPTYLGSTVQYFDIDAQNKYRHYRLFCIDAEPHEPGLSYMQLYCHLD